MLSSSEIQSAYNDLYEQMREYIWGYYTVDALADLEVAVYLKCPDIFDIRRCYNRLFQQVIDVYQKDEDLAKVFNAFKDLIESSDDLYSKILYVGEVVE